MTKTRTFRNTTGYPFTIHAPLHTVRVEADGDYETDDEAVAQLLVDSGRVEEVKSAAGKVKDKVIDTDEASDKDAEDD